MSAVLFGCKNDRKDEPTPLNKRRRGVLLIGYGVSYAPQYENVRLARALVRTIRLSDAGLKMPCNMCPSCITLAKLGCAVKGQMSLAGSVL